MFKAFCGVSCLVFGRGACVNWTLVLDLSFERFVSFYNTRTIMIYRPQAIAFQQVLQGTEALIVCELIEREKKTLMRLR